MQTAKEDIFFMKGIGKLRTGTSGETKKSCVSTGFDGLYSIVDIPFNGGDSGTLAF